MAKSLYQKELDRVQHLIKRYEKKGYTTAYNRSTLKELSFEELRGITPVKVREEVTYADYSTGDIYTYEEREQQIKEERKQKIRAKKELKRMEQDEEYRNRFNEANLVYNEFINRLNTIGVNNPETQSYLLDVLNEQIAIYGRDKVIMRMADSGSDIIEATEIALYYKQGYGGWQTAVNHIMQIITGNIPTAEESSKFEEQLDSEYEVED